MIFCCSSFFHLKSYPGGWQKKKNVKSRDYERTLISWQNLSCTLDNNFPNVSLWEQLLTQTEPQSYIKLAACMYCTSSCCLSESFVTTPPSCKCHDHTYKVILNCQKFDLLGSRNHKSVRYGLTSVWSAALMLESIRPYC